VYIVIESIYTHKMDPFLKSSLKTQIEVYLQKFPNASTEDIKTWVKTGVQVPMLQGVKRKTLNKFILYQKKKFQSTGSCAKHRGGNGRSFLNLKDMFSHGRRKGK